jgi:hypothetical protein
MIFSELTQVLQGYSGEAIRLADLILDRENCRIHKIFMAAVIQRG